MPHFIFHTLCFILQAISDAIGMPHFIFHTLCFILQAISDAIGMPHSPELALPALSELALWGNPIGDDACVHLVTQAAYYLLLATCCVHLVTQATYHLPLTTYYLLRTPGQVGYLILTTTYLLLTVCTRPRRQ